MFWNKSRALKAAAEASATVADGVRLDEAMAPYTEATKGPAAADPRRARRLVSAAGNTSRPASFEKV